MSKVCYQLTLPCRMVGCCSQPIKELVQSPFFPYFCVSTVLNGIPIVLGLVYISPLNRNCPSGSHWLFWNALLCIIHIIAAVFLLHKVRHTELRAIPQINDLTECGIPCAATVEEDLNDNYQIMKDQNLMFESAHNANKNSVPKSTMRRVCKVMCEEPCLGIYWVLLVFWILWLGIGVYRTVYLDSRVCQDVLFVCLAAVGCGVSYLGLALFTYWSSPQEYVSTLDVVNNEKDNKTVQDTMPAETTAASPTPSTSYA